MQDKILPGEANFQLFRLPKERSVLDFVLQKLGEGASPERYELLEALLSMYRTSTGFNPLAMSKARFKRLKAAEFRQTLAEIDQEIGCLLQSPEYRQYMTRKADIAPLFEQYNDLSSAVQLHPALSLTDELDAFENKCERHEAEELLLSFYRQQPHFIEEIYRKEGPAGFLKKYDRILERQHHLQRQFRISFEIILLEQAADKGILNDEKAKALLSELGVLLTSEPQVARQYTLLLKIIRTAQLTSSPARNMAPWLDFLQEAGSALLAYHPEAVLLILTALARYCNSAGRAQRLHWLDEAEKEARLQELQDERPGLRLIRAMAEADAGDMEAALRCLNEVEHLIYRATTRSLSSRNNWVRLAELKTLLLTLKTLQGNEPTSEQFRHLRQLAEDMGRHRHEITVLLLEWKGLELFTQQSYEEAFSNFDKARNYRKNQTDHPWYLLDRFFCTILRKTKKKNDAAPIILAMKDLKEPFYSEVCCSIMELSRQNMEQRQNVPSSSEYDHFTRDHSGPESC